MPTSGASLKVGVEPTTAFPFLHLGPAFSQTPSLLFMRRGYGLRPDRFSTSLAGYHSRLVWSRPYAFCFRRWSWSLGTHSGLGQPLVVSWKTLYPAGNTPQSLAPSSTVSFRLGVVPVGRGPKSRPNPRRVLPAERLCMQPGTLDAHTQPSPGFLSLLLPARKQAAPPETDRSLSECWREYHRIFQFRQMSQVGCPLSMFAF